MAVEEKGLRLIKNTIMGLLWIGMTVQIILGAAWIIGNLPAQGLFPDTAYYLKAAAGGARDEYVGVLYPLLVRILWGIGSLWGIGGEWLLSLLQLGAAALCGFGFLSLCDIGGGFPGWKKILGTSYLVTIPLCVQWHLTILPRSFVGSLTFLLLGVCIRNFLEDQAHGARRICQSAVIWVILTWLDPDAWWLGGILVLFVVIGFLARHRGRKGAKTQGDMTRGKGAKAQGDMARGKGVILLGVLAVVLTAGLVAQGGNRLFREPGCNGRIQRSLGSALVSRFVWPNFGKNYFFWPDEIKEIMTPEEGAAYLADDVGRVFGPLAEKAYGKERANELYWEMALQCFGNRTKEVASAIKEDFLSYLFLPWRVYAQLHGMGLSYSGWNYSKMLEKTPLLSKRYMDYGLLSFQIGFWCVALLAGISVYEKRKGGGRLSLACVVVVILCLGSQSFWYTMSGAGMMDYGNVTAVSLLWFGMIPAALGSFAQRRK